MLKESYSSFGVRAAFSLFLILGMVGLQPARPVLATTFLVTNTSDNDPGSLRQAIANAGSGDTISFDPSLSNGIINLFSPLVIDKNLTIDGSTLSNQVSIDLREQSNIQILNSTVTILNLTIQRGYSNGDGGAIWSNGNLTLANSTIKSSHAAGNGGGIYTSRALTIRTSAIYDNQADLDGGGIYATTAGDQVQIANSTFFQNYAYQAGGGIYTTGNTHLQIRNGTIAQNYAGVISQVMSQGQSQVTLVNSILACWSPRNSTDCYNFIQFPVTTNSILGIKDNTYGLLDLADNGGFTKTMSMEANSPLIDAGDDAACSSSPINNIDQRGMPRPYGSHCDIGAYELTYLTVSGNVDLEGTSVKDGYGLFIVVDNTGNYSFKILPGWSGSVIPSKQGYTFNPAKRDFTDVQINQLDQNFSAAGNSFVYPGDSGDTRRISIPAGSGQANNWSRQPSISADGRYVAYESQASNIVPGNWANDILVYDNQTGQTSLASVHSDGTPFQSNSYAASISADGRYVAFVSFEWYGTAVVFVHDRHTGLTTGLPFNGSPMFAARPSISGDGRYVAYMHYGPLTGHENISNKYNIFVYDQWNASLERVSKLPNGDQPNGDSLSPIFSGNGRYVVFQSSSTDIVADDTNGVDDIFVYDFETDQTNRVSVNSSSTQSNGGSFLPSISEDGRYIAWHSIASNLVSNDTNGAEDVFVRDIQTGVTSRVSTSSNGIQGNLASNHAHLSANGRYVAFRSLATNLVPGDTNNVADIFIYDRQRGQTKRVSVDSRGGQANGNSPSVDSADFSISGDGKFVAFSSDATNLVASDTNNEGDIFVHETTSLYTKVTIGPNQVGSYDVPYHTSLQQSFVGANNGPVKIQRIDGTRIVASERVAYSPDGGTTWTSYSELMGLPSNQISTSYTFSWYNNVDLNSQLRFANVGSANTTVTVTVGGQIKGTYPLIPGQSTRVSYNGLNAGPIKVTSSGNVPIIASERVAYFDGSAWTSFSELMGLPSTKLTTSYTFPWYNNADINSQLRFGNVGTANTTVTVTVGGQIKGSYLLKPNESTRISYSSLNAGPVQVTSSGNVPIITSMRVAYFDGARWTDFTEMMGMPTSELSTNYSFPVYNNIDLNTQLRFGNVGTTNTNVTVTIGGVVQGTYFLAPNQSTRVRYDGLNSGPVVIQSSGNVPIIASQRVAYFDSGPGKWTSFAEMMGLPKEQLATTYLFPWYNNVDLNTQLRFGVP